jgi:hypothetical protein
MEHVAELKTVIYLSDYNWQHHFACSFVWVSDLVSYIGRIIRAERFREEGAEEDIWT